MVHRKANATFLQISCVTSLNETLKVHSACAIIQQQLQLQEVCTLCLHDWPTGAVGCHFIDCPLSRSKEVDPLISFKIGADFQLQDGTNVVVKLLSDSVVKSLALLSPTEAFDMCEQRFANDMFALGNHLQAELQGKQFEGLFSLRSTSVPSFFNCFLSDNGKVTGSGNYYMSTKFRSVFSFMVHALQRYNAGTSTRC